MTQASDPQVIVIPPDGGQLFKGGPMTLHVIEDGSHTSGTRAVADFAFDGQFSPPPHVHRQHEEVIYVLEGQMGFWVKGETMTLGPGSAFVTPIGLPHTFSNAGSGRLRFLLTASPASHLGYFEQVAELLQNPGPPDPQAMMAIMQKWGLEPIKPA